MAYNLSVQDTHRIPYCNATVTARKVGEGETDDLKFYTSTGVDLGFEVRTNARGYFCTGAGQIITDGVFVQEDAIITAMLGDGSGTSWVVVKDDSVEVHDGKLYGTVDRDNPTLEVKWGANSPEDYILNYNHLINKPALNEWMEVEQVVVMDGLGTQKGSHDDSIEIDKHAKTVTIKAKTGFGPQSWKYENDTWAPVDTDNPNGPWSIKLLASSDRVAQLICVRNLTPWRLALYNSSDDLIEVLDAYDGGDTGKQVTLYGVENNIRNYRATTNIEKLNLVHSVLFGADSVNRSASNPIAITDQTPDVLQLQYLYTYPYSPANLYITSQVTKSRTIKLWLQNFKTAKALIVHDCTSGSPVFIAVAPNFSVIELIVTPTSIIPKAEPLAVYGPALTLNVSDTNYILPPDATFITGSILGSSVVDCGDDIYTDKMIYGTVHNAYNGYQRTLRLRINGADITFVLPAGPSDISFVVHKMGGTYCVIKSPSGSGARVVPNNALARSGDNFPVVVPVPTTTDFEIDINYNQVRFLESSLGVDLFGSKSGDNRLLILTELTDNVTYTGKIHIDTFINVSAGVGTMIIDMIDNTHSTNSVTLYTDMGNQVDGYNYTNGGTLEFNLARSGTTLILSNLRWV